MTRAGVSPVLVGFLALHLAIAVIFAVRGLQQTMLDAKRTAAKPMELPPTVNLYANATASSQGFGFFAPSVASEVRVVVVGCKRTEGKWRELDLGIRGEGQQLLSSFLGIGLQSDGPESKAIHDTLSRSLAASALNQHPEIDAVIVKYQAEWIAPLRSPEPQTRTWFNLRVFPYYRPNS